MLENDGFVSNDVISGQLPSSAVRGLAGDEREPLVRIQRLVDKPKHLITTQQLPLLNKPYFETNKMTANYDDKLND